MHLVDSNVSHQPLPATGAIELAFDRLLLPASVTRQSFPLEDLRGVPLNPPLPTVAYDPVARVVTVTPGSPLDPTQPYKIAIVSPKSPTDLMGLRAIDNAPFDPSFQPIEFMVGPAAVPPTPPTVDFCKDVLPNLQGRCAVGACHGPPMPAAGLLLTSDRGIAATAVGRVALGANSGPLSAPGQPQRQLFGVDMAIVNPGDPGESWLLYKLLLAKPSACSPTDAGPALCNGGHSLQTQAMSDAERAALSDLVQGREMPFPVLNLPPGTAQGLQIDQLEAISLWIAGGAPASCTSM